MAGTDPKQEQLSSYHCTIFSSPIKNYPDRLRKDGLQMSSCLTLLRQAAHIKQSSAGGFLWPSAKLILRS